jgi:hypothetical protein
VPGLDQPFDKLGVDLADVDAARAQSVGLP